MPPPPPQSYLELHARTDVNLSNETGSLGEPFGETTVPLVTTGSAFPLPRELLGIDKTVMLAVLAGQHV